MRLNHITRVLSFSAALLAPLMVQANSIWHPADGDSGFTYHGDHFKSTTTRAEVQAELEAARKDGTLTLIQRGVPVPNSNAGPGKTRQQVIDEMRNEPEEQRRHRLEMFSGG